MKQAGLDLPCREKETQLTGHNLSGLGGRLLTLIDKTGDSLDLGGQWVGPESQQTHIWQLLRRFSISTHPQRYVGKRILDLRRSGIDLVFYDSDIPSGLGLVALLVTQFLLWWVDLSVYFRVKWKIWAAPETSSTLLQFKQLLRWIPVSETRKAAPLALAGTLIRGVFGAEACKLSWPHFLRYVCSAGGVERLATIRNGFQESVIDGGAQQLCKHLAREIQASGGCILHNETVVRISKQGDELFLIECFSGATFNATHIVFAIPPAKKAEIQFQDHPDFCKKQLSIHKKACMGCIIKIVLCYETAFWLERGFSGEVICDPSLEAPVFNVYDHTINGHPKLVCFINGDMAEEWSKRAHTERKQAVLSQLVGWYGEEASSPNEYFEKDWVADVFTGGCPVGCFPPDTDDDNLDLLTKPSGRLLWAGTETADICQGFMSGAVQSGERAANQLFADVKRHGISD